MKRAIYFIVLASSLFASYYLGVQVGLGHMWGHAHSIQANAALNKIKVPLLNVERLEYCEDSRTQENEMVILGSLQAYRDYLIHWSSNFPTFTAHDKATTDWFAKPASYMYNKLEAEQRRFYSVPFKELGISDEQ